VDLLITKNRDFHETSSSPVWNRPIRTRTTMVVSAHLQYRAQTARRHRLEEGTISQPEASKNVLLLSFAFLAQAAEAAALAMLQ